MEARAPKKRSGARFNIIDFLIILVVLLCVIGLIIRYTTVLDKIGISDRMEQYEVSFTVENLRYTTPSFFDIGDRVYLRDGSNTYMGTLISRENGSTDTLTITLSSQYIQSDTGFISAYYAENTLVDISGRILCDGMLGEDGYFLLGGDVYVAQGQTLSVCTDLVSFDLIVTNIAPSTQENTVLN